MKKNGSFYVVSILLITICCLVFSGCSKKTENVQQSNTSNGNNIETDTKTDNIAMADVFEGTISNENEIDDENEFGNEDEFEEESTTGKIEDDMYIVSYRNDAGVLINAEINKELVKNTDAQNIEISKQSGDPKKAAEIYYGEEIDDSEFGTSIPQNINDVLVQSNKDIGRLFTLFGISEYDLTKTSDFDEDECSFEVFTKDGLMFSLTVIDDDDVKEIYLSDEN